MAVNKNEFFEKFVNNLRVWVNPEHANKSFKHISIVYGSLAGGYGIGYSEPLTCRFGQVDGELSR